MNVSPPDEVVPSDAKGRYTVVTLVLLATSFIVDLQLARGVAAGIAYTLAILVALRVPGNRFVVGCTCASIVLTVLGWWFSPSGIAPEWQVASNRLLSIGVVILTAWLGILWRADSTAVAHEQFLSRSLMDNVPDVIFFKDRESRFIRVNRAFLNVVGLSTDDQAIGLTDHDLFEREQADAFRADEVAVMESREPIVNQQQWETWQDGRRRYVLTTKLPLLDDRGACIGTFGISREVTSSKEAELRLVAALEGANVGLWDWDASGELVYYSAGYRAQLGEPAEPLVETFEYWHERVHPDDRDAVVEASTAYIENPVGPYEQTYRLRHSDGGYRWILSRGRFVNDEEGRPIRMLGVNIDVTEQVEREGEIERKTRELERSNADLDQFAYVASHDLKAPLQGIENLSQWILEDAGDLLPEASREHLEKMIVRVGRMKQLLNDLLVFSRIGRKEGHVSRIDVEKLVGEIVEDDPRSEGFDLFVDVGNVSITSAVVPLRHVLGNLLSNAFKHHDCPPGHVGITATEQGDVVEFVVADDGPGIPVDQRGRVFDMFQQLKPKSEVEGSGMGLAIVRKTIEQRGGTIVIESVNPPGEDGATPRGTRFRFTWPREPAPEVDENSNTTGTTVIAR